MSVLQAAGAVARFAERFARTNDAHYAARIGEVRANAWLLRPALDFVNILLIVAIVAAFGTQTGCRAWKSGSCMRSLPTSRASSSR